jgi:hypothetical protein
MKAMHLMQRAWDAYAHAAGSCDIFNRAKKALQVLNLRRSGCD